MQDFEPRVPMNLSEAEIDQLGLLKWENRKLTVDVPEDYGRREMRQFQDYSKRMDLTAAGQHNI